MRIAAHNGPVRAAVRDWTVLYVLDGDNDLREPSTLDLVELDQKGAPENVNVAAQVYRGDLKWNLHNFGKKVGNLFKPDPPAAVNPDWRGMKVFEVRHQNSTETTDRVEFQDSTSPSDPNSLENFVAWGMQKYPAKNYAVVLTGHGGPDGLLSDSAGTKMPFKQVSTALKAGAKRAGSELDVILFDSCSTASDKMAETMQGSAKFLVASPGKISARGWSESSTMDFLKSHPQATPKELAQSFLSPVHNIDEPILYEL
jgi:cysteine peptidase C11 family protein